MSVAWYIVLEREIPGFDHAVNGKALAKAGDQLEALAKDNKLPTLISFFSISPDELAGFAADHGVALEQQASQEKWFSAEDGLNTINALLDAKHIRKLDVRVVSDLQEFKTVLETAKRNGVGWHLAVDY